MAALFLKEKKELPVDDIALDLDELDMVSGGDITRPGSASLCGGMF